jgi:UDP-glucose 4-epimerase
MRILVTGASGFIGRHLLDHLSSRHELFAIVRSPQPVLSQAAVNAIEMDLAQEWTATNLPARTDVIIHLAQANVAFPESANELFAVNASATQNLLDYGRRAGAQQFILASTGDIYGWKEGLAKETDEAHPASFYAVTKYAAELLAQSYSDYFATCALRLFHPYGPGQAMRLIPKLAERIRQQKAVQVHQRDCPHLTPIYIADVISAIERAIDSTYSGAINIAGDQIVSMRELAAAIGHTLGSQPVFEETGKESTDLAGDNRLMKQVLDDWPLVPLAEGLSWTFNQKEAASWQAHL